MLLVILDSFLLFLAGFLTLFLRYGSPEANPFWGAHLQSYFVLSPCWIIIFYIEGLLSLKNYYSLNLIPSAIRAVLLGTLVSVVYFYIAPSMEISPKTNILIFSSFTCLFVILSRKILKIILNSKSLKRKVFLIGPSNLTQAVQNISKKNAFLGLNTFSCRSKSDEITDKLNSLNPSDISFLSIDKKFLQDKNILRALYKFIVSETQIIELNELYEKISGEIHLDNMEATWIVDSFASRKKFHYNFFKNIFDKSLAFLIFLITLPVTLILLPILAITSGFPIFFKQTRVGAKNKNFILYKFRTMVRNAEENGAKWATPNDSRVTKIGRILRKTRLDELPQLVNIIKGDMSLIGPRPERPEFLSELAKKYPLFKHRSLVKPGLSGWAQTHYGYGFTEEDSIKKLKLDLYYIKHRSFWLDFKIILKTIKTVLTGVGH